MTGAGEGRRAQLARLRRLARSALAGYGLQDAPLVTLRHQHNTTFRVGGRYVLRIGRPGVHTPETVASELAWLHALRRDTGLAVPEPVPRRDGALAVRVSDPLVPEPRVCALFRWLDGRFVDARLAPAHLRRVARLTAALHDHAGRWTPPGGFARPRVDALTTPARAAGVSGSPSAGPGWREDADRGLELIAGAVPDADATPFSAAFSVVEASARELAAEPRAAGLIHGDLHQENYLFAGAVPRVIDFDDCGWGFFLYDLAVTLFELEDRPAYERLRAALLEEYAALRPLPARTDVHLAAFAILRRMQMLMWVLESRDHAAFRDDWLTWTRSDLAGLAAAVEAMP